MRTASKARIILSRQIIDSVSTGYMQFMSVEVAAQLYLFSRDPGLSSTECDELLRVMEQGLDVETTWTKV